MQKVLNVSCGTKWKALSASRIMIGLHFSSQQLFLPKTVRHKDSGQALQKDGGRPWAKIGKSSTPLRAVHIFIILLFMNYWNTSQDITIVCLPLTKFWDTPLHQARKKQLMFLWAYVYLNLSRFEYVARIIKNAGSTRNPQSPKHTPLYRNLSV